MVTSHVVTLFPTGTFFGDGFTFAMACEVVHCLTVMCIWWTPLVLRPSVAVVIVTGFLTRKTLETVWKWGRICRRSHIMEIDISGKSAGFQCDEEVDEAED